MTTTNLKTQAIQRAKRLLLEFGIKDVPVDVQTIGSELGIKVSYEVFDDDTSGVIVVKNGQAVIGVNKAHPATRQRFTIAHEIGHFLLHGKRAGVFIDAAKIYYRDPSTAEGKDIQEIQANTFAAELLMPEQAIHNYIETYGIDFSDDDSMAPMASKFEVSVQALTNRLTNLGYEPY
jgi:Zn-dependent peptidase ImmA (M78 family)